MFTKLAYQVARSLRAAKWRALDSFATFYYRWVCQSFGNGARVGWGTWISYPYRVSIGDGVVIGRKVAVVTENPMSTLTVASGVQINDRVHIDFTGGVSIGERALISEGAVLYSHSHGRDPRSPPIGCEKLIGSGVWIGARALVMHSCSEIGSSAIVGAGAIVTHSIGAAQIVVSPSQRIIA